MGPGFPSKSRVFVISSGFLAATVVLAALAYAERGELIAWLWVVGALCGLTVAAMGFVGLWLARDITDEEVVVRFDALHEPQDD